MRGRSEVLIRTCPFLNEMEMEIKNRLAAGNKSYHALGPILKKSISQSITIRLYKSYDQK
jgi:hypothetical protein